MHSILVSIGSMDSGTQDKLDLEQVGILSSEILLSKLLGGCFHRWNKEELSPHRPKADSHHDIL